MISFLFFSIRRAWQGFWRNALMSLAATATMVLMLLLLAGFFIIQKGLLAGLEFTEQKVEVVGTSSPTSPIAGGALQAKLVSMPEVDRWRTLPARTRSKRSSERLKAQGGEDLTQDLDSNPLHASLEVKLVDRPRFGDRRRRCARTPSSGR